MKHKIISAVILLALEAIIISLALWAGEHFDIPTNILVLDIVVLTIMLVLGGYESFQPLFAMVFKKLDEVASLGLRWMSLAFYMVCALVLIVLGVIIPISFFFQLIGQVFLLVILLGSYLMSSTTAGHIAKVAETENTVRGKGIPNISKPADNVRKTAAYAPPPNHHAVAAESTPVGRSMSDPILRSMSKDEIRKSIAYTTEQMREAARQLDFMQAAMYRDELLRLQDLLGDDE